VLECWSVGVLECWSDGNGNTEHGSRNWKLGSGLWHAILFFVARRRRSIEQERITLIGAGFELEEDFYSKVLGSIQELPKTQQALWFSRAVGMYCNYDRFDRAADMARELMKLPTRVRAVHDNVVAKALVYRAAEYDLALEYLNLATRGRPKLGRLVSGAMFDDELVLLRALATIRAKGTSEKLRSETISRLVSFYAFSPPTKPFLEVLDEYEDEVLSLFLARAALFHVSSKLALQIRVGNRGEVEDDLERVESAITKLAERGDAYF